MNAVSLEEKERESFDHYKKEKLSVIENYHWKMKNGFRPFFNVFIIFKLKEKTKCFIII